MSTKDRFKFLKYFDLINTVLALFVVVSTLFIYSIIELNDKIKSFNVYYNDVVKLKVLQSEFDGFMGTKATFINYDYLVYKIKSTQTLLGTLNSDEFYKDFGEDLRAPMKTLHTQWSDRAENIERFKSINASIVGSINYILSLSSNINQEYLNNNVEDIFLVDSVKDCVFRLFVNSDGDSKIVDEQTSKKFENLALKYNNLELTFLIKRVKSLLKDLQSLNRVQKNYFESELQNTLAKIEQRLNDVNRQNIQKQQDITTLLLLSSAALLFLFIYVYVKSLKTKEELIAFKYAVENSYNAIVITDKNRAIKYVNDAFEKTTGYAKDEVLGRDPRLLKSGEMSRAFYDNLNKVLSSKQKWSGEFINKNKSGDVYYENSSITPIIIDDELKGYLAIKLDVSEYVRQKQKVEFLAYHDSLTFLPNRRALLRDIVQILEDAELNNKKIAMLFVDLDGFKFINDGLGHDTGDKLLKEISYRLANTLENKHNTYRLGGDEFAIIFEYDSDKQIEIASRDIIDKVNFKTYINKHSLHVGCSIGIARYPLDAKDYSSLMKYSDTAMYKAKQNGKNRYEFYAKDLTNVLSKRFEIEQALSGSLKNDEFYVLYQPKLCFKTSKIYSVEALLRWRSGVLGEVLPDRFIPVAEESGFIDVLGLFVFKRACEDFSALREKLGISMVSINVSVIQLIQDDFMDQIKQILYDTKVDPSQIGIELTETYLIKNIDNILDILKQMRELGFKILIDDFGTGYSSLKYLQELPIDVLKIDKSFVQNINKTNNDILKAVVAISKSFGYLTIAEGVETKEQEDFLIKLDVDIAQGFLYSKPKRLTEFV